MSCEPFDIQPVIERLKANVEALRQVAGAADFAAIQKLGEFPVPCAYVLLASETGEANQPGHAMPDTQIAVRQRVPVTFGVVVAVRNFREQAGAQSAETLRPILGAIRAQLVGWTPPDCTLPCMFQRGNLRDYDRATTLWIDLFATQHFIGVTP